VHQDCADESSSHHLSARGKHDLEIIAENDGSNEEDHQNLDAEDEHGGVVRVMNVVLVEV
jgi:hypothetical protein